MLDVINATESVSYLTPKIWEQIPPDIKSMKSWEGFRKKTKIWKLGNCLCRICKVFIPNLGFHLDMRLYLLIHCHSL